jgi:hypothetical protein
MIKKDKPWWMCFDRWALVLMVLGAWVVNGANQLRVLGIGMVLAFIVKYALANEKWKMSEHPPELFSYTSWGVWTGLTGLFVCISHYFFWIHFKVLLQMIVMIWAIYGLLRLRMSERLIYWVIIIGCILQIVAVKLGYSFEKDYGVVIGEEHFGEARVSGLTGNANGLGFLLLSGVNCVMQLWRMRRSPFNILLKLILAGFVLAALYVTWQTGSRKTSAAMVILILGWLIWLLPQGKGIASLFIRSVAVIVLLAIGGLVFAFISDQTVVGKRFIELFDRGGGSVIGGVEDDVRSDMYKAGWQMFKENPIAGVGLAHYQLYYWKGAYSHSDYMEPLACTGLVGFFLYHSFNIFLLKRILHLRKRIKNADELYRLNAMLLTIFVNLLLGFGAPYWSSQRTYILLMTFVVYTWMLERRLMAEARNSIMRVS